MKTLLFYFLTLILSSAQLIVKVQPVKDQFVAHEDVVISLSITNRAGKTMTLRGDNNKNWLSINLKNQSGEILPYINGNPAFKAVVLPVGQTVEKKFVMNGIYDVTRYGRYSVQANIKLPGDTTNSIPSNSDQFLITAGRTLFSQRVGLPNTANERKIEVIKFNGSKKAAIYVKITNEYNGEVESCKALSTIVPFSDPKGALDKNNSLHLLYLIRPDLYTHVVVSPTGKIVKRSYHKHGAIGDPRLDSFEDGSVQVGNTVPWDPTSDGAGNTRKASERPTLSN